MKELRIVQKMDENGSFNSIRMGDLKKGDTFRIFELKKILTTRMVVCGKLRITASC